MERVDLGGIDVTWEPTARVCALRFRDGANATEPAARVLVQHLDRWAAERAGPWSVIVDARGLGDATAGWRAVLGDFLGARRDRVRIAWCNARPPIRVMVRLFALATRVDARVFRSEDEARRALVAREVPA